MLLRHVLAVVDFSVPGLHAAWRAARLAWAHDADLRLVALVAASDRRPASRFGPSAPPVRAHSDLSFLAEEIVHTLGVRTAVSVGAGGDAWEALCIQARMADLAVLPDATARLRMNGWWHSGLAEQLLRTTGVPVLVARRPSGVVHRRALVAADPDSKAVPALLQAARWFCGEEGIRACHVMGPEVERHLHAADLPLPAVNAWLETAGARARAALSRQLAQAGLHGAQAVVLHGERIARLTLEQERSGASLLVLDKARQPWWVDLFLRAPARRLADRVRCDVLWVPSPWRSAQSARRRLDAPRPALP